MAFECPICFSRFTRNLKAPTTLRCGHSFCMSCVMALREPYVHEQDSSVLTFGLTSQIHSICETLRFKLKMVLHQDSYTCPFCRYKTLVPERQIMPKNFMMLEMLAALDQLDEDKPRGDATRSRGCRLSGPPAMARLLDSTAQENYALSLHRM